MVEMNPRKIRVCFVGPKAYPIFNPDIQSVFGGAEVDLYMVATELAKDEGFDVSFIVADYGQPQEEMRENVRLLKSLDFKQNPITGALKIWKAFKRTDADIYIMKTASPGVLLVHRFCKRHHRMFIYKTAHEHECNGVYFQEHPLMGRFFVNSLKKAAQVIVQNKQDQTNLEKYFSVESVVIANGHRTPENTEGKKETILWVGRSAAFKGPWRFLKLAKKFPEKRFVMICQRASDDTQYNDLKIDASKINNLTFIERVPFHEIDGYFEQARVFVNTSDSEGFPNTFIQACKASTAILSYAVNPDGFLDTHQCGINCCGNETTLMDQLHEMLDGDRCLKLGRNGKVYVMEKHDLTKIVEQYKKLFREIV